MKPVDDELFAQIKESLTEHEEVYTPGAWERFEKKGKNKIRMIWLSALSSAAAVLLIGFAFFYSGDQSTPANEMQEQVKTADVVPDVGDLGTAIEDLKTEIAVHKNIAEHKIAHNTPNDAIVVKINQPENLKPAVMPSAEVVIPSVQGNVLSVITTDVTGKKDLQGAVDVTELVAKTVVKDTVEINKPRSFEEFLDAEVKSNSAIAAIKPSAKKTDKWEMGLMVAPSMGNAKKLNMGYGLSMDYAVSDKVSITSGISYSEMGATKSIGGSNGSMDAPANMAMVKETKSLKSVDANLVGIDIPLGIKYYLSKKFYTNFGVSAFAVLNQKQHNNFIQGAVEYPSAPNQLADASFKALFQERAVSESVPSGEIRGDKYLGFYNVSFGFKQQVSGNKAFSVEPFMKLPMKEFTKENLYLIGTGVKLKFDF